MVLASLIATLVVAGLFIFASAALGFLGRGATNVTSVAFNHMVIGGGVGIILLIIGCIVDYNKWRTLAPYLFITALTVTAFVFIPQIGMEHGGGKRWLSILGMTVQPSEALKITTVLMAAAYFAAIRGRVATLHYGLAGFLAIMAVPTTILILQPDLGTLGIITFATFAVFFAAGARWRDMGLIVCIGLLSLGTLAYFRPYVWDRVAVFINPAQGQQAEGYQIKQSLIAIGSGGLAGRGFGQSVQKFTYLPEPMGDSIFAVVGEEMGFVGAVILVILFLALALRGYATASNAPDLFGALVAVGIATYLTSEAFINIAAMIGIAPLTGVPLTFISQGGSAMLVSLASAGILLNISRRRNKG